MLVCIGAAKQPGGRRIAAELGEPPNAFFSGGCRASDSGSCGASNAIVTCREFLDGFK